MALEHVGEGLSGWELHVRILPSGFPPAVIPRQGERSDDGPACATATCESPILPPTSICHLAVGMVEGLAEMVRVMLSQCGNAQERRDRAPVDGHRSGRLLHVANGIAEGEAEAWRMGWQRPPGSWRLWRAAKAAALTKDKIGFLHRFLHRGATPLGTLVDAGEEEVTRQMLICSRRRPPPRDLVMLQWKNKVVVQEVPRAARWSRGETFGRWDVTVYDHNLGSTRQAKTREGNKRTIYTTHTEHSADHTEITQTSHTYQTPPVSVCLSRPHAPHHTLHTTHTEHHTPHTEHQEASAQ